MAPIDNRTFRTTAILDFSTTVFTPFRDAVVILLLNVGAFVFFVNDRFNSVGKPVADGTDDGDTEGFVDTLGISDGAAEGLSDNEGISDGGSEGFADTLGMIDAYADGRIENEGTSDGAAEGFADTLGMFDGAKEGPTDNEGASDGAAEGLADIRGKALMRDSMRHWANPMVLQRPMELLRVFSLGCVELGSLGAFDGILLAFTLGAAEAVLV